MFEVAIAQHQSFIVQPIETTVLARTRGEYAELLKTAGIAQWLVLESSKLQIPVRVWLSAQ